MNTPPRLGRIARGAPAVAIGLCLAFGLAAASATAQAGAVDPKATQLLEEVGKAYQSLPGYSDHGRFLATLKPVGDAKARSLATPISIAAQRPDKVEVAVGEFRLVCDGKTMTIIQYPLKSQLSEPLQGALSAQRLTDLCPQLKAVTHGNADGLPALIMLQLLLDPNPAQSIAKKAKGLTLEPNRPWNGGDAQSLVVEHELGIKLRLLIQPQTKLVGRIEIILDPQKTKSIESLAWEAGEVQQKLSADAFAVQAVAEFLSIPALEKAFASQPKADKPRGGGGNRLVGQPAPLFLINVLDAESNTEQLSKADLEGKVVLLDFWATWCGPCLQELPEIQELIEYYHQLKKEVVVLAVSQDRPKPNDAEDAVAKLVQETLTTRKLNLRQGKVGLVALDPENEVGQAFGVQALPTVVVIDPNGVVKSVHVGFNPQIRQTLGKEIDALLQPPAAKPKPEPKPDPKADSKGKTEPSR